MTQREQRDQATCRYEVIEEMEWHLKDMCIGVNSEGLESRDPQILGWGLGESLGSRGIDEILLYPMM